MPGVLYNLMPKADKSDLRQRLRTRRAAIPAADRAVLARLAAERAAFLLKPHSRIALYYATREELSTQALAELLWRDEKSVYLPVINKTRKLSFRLWTPDTVLALSRLKTCEPEASGSDLVAEQLDAVVLPLVGFDRSGARLGMGGGFYDSTLRRPPADSNSKVDTGTKISLDLKPIKIGLAFDIQEIEYVPTEEHDVALDYLVTPTQIIACAASEPY